MPQHEKRQDFLIAMYEQLMGDINRHIMVVWQSIATLVAAVAVFSFVKDNVIPFDIAVSIILIICVWLLMHVYDAGYWYNRNLAMISNIERQFLDRDDLKNIHYYFGSHRPNNKLIDHLSYQKELAFMTAGVFLAYHFYSVVYLNLSQCKLPGLLSILPWAIAVYGFFRCRKIRARNEEKYLEFISNSPGKVVDNSGMHYGAGHGH